MRRLKTQSLSRHADANRAQSLQHVFGIVLPAMPFRSFTAYSTEAMKAIA
jgi:hypothetical protein